MCLSSALFTPNRRLIARVSSQPSDTNVVLCLVRCVSASSAISPIQDSPEYVDIAAPASGLLSAAIERIDDLGRTRFARVRIGDTRLAARVPPGLSVPGDTAGLIFDPAHVHVYADSILVEGKA